jgi:hypothetical protein
MATASEFHSMLGSLSFDKTVLSCWQIEMLLPRFCKMSNGPLSRIYIAAMSSVANVRCKFKKRELSLAESRADE